MDSVEFLPGFGVATKCEAEKYHSPKPLRFVFHHVLPRTCGGETVASNLIQVCDVCHYAAHCLMYELARNEGKLTDHWHLGGTGRYHIARRGYEAAVAAGTVDKIPNEGGAE